MSRAATYFAHGGKVGKTPPGTRPMGYGCADAPPRPIGRFPRTPLRWEPIRQAWAVNAKARVAQPIGFRSMTAAAELSITFGGCSDRWKARLCGWRGSSWAQGAGGRMISAPTKCGESFRPFVGADDLGGPRAAQVCRPYGFNGTVSENETVSLIRHGFAVPPYPFCPCGTFPPDRGNRPSPRGRQGDSPSKPSPLGEGAPEGGG